jgi:hypothetical protein
MSCVELLKFNMWSKITWDTGYFFYNIFFSIARVPLLWFYFALHLFLFCTKNAKKYKARQQWNSHYMSREMKHDFFFFTSRSSVGEVSRPFIHTAHIFSFSCTLIVCRSMSFEFDQRKPTRDQFNAFLKRKWYNTHLIHFHKVPISLFS